MKYSQGGQTKKAKTEVRLNAPEDVLTDPRFLRTSAVKAFFETSGDWSYGNPQLARKLAGVGRALVSGLAQSTNELEVLATFAECTALRIEDGLENLLEAGRKYAACEQLWVTDFSLPPLLLANLYRRIALVETQLALDASTPEEEALHWTQSENYHVHSRNQAMIRDNHEEGRALAAWGTSRYLKAYYGKAEDPRSCYEQAESFFELARARVDPKKSMALFKATCHDLEMAQIATGCSHPTRSYYQLRMVDWAAGTRKRSLRRRSKRVRVGVVRPPKSGNEASI